MGVRVSEALRGPRGETCDTSGHRWDQRATGRDPHLELVGPTPQVQGPGPRSGPSVLPRDSKPGSPEPCSLAEGSGNTTLGRTGGWRQRDR